MIAEQVLLDYIQERYRYLARTAGISPIIRPEIMEQRIQVRGEIRAALRELRRPGLYNVKLLASATRYPHIKRKYGVIQKKVLEALRKEGNLSSKDLMKRTGLTRRQVWDAIKGICKWRHGDVSRRYDGEVYYTLMEKERAA